MDEHSLQNNSDLQSPSFNVQGNYGYVPYVVENTFFQQHLLKPEDYDNCSLPQWTGYQHLAPNYVDYLLGNEISNMQGELPYETSGVGCSFTPKESFISMDAHQAEVRLSMKEHDEVPVCNYEETQHICQQLFHYPEQQVPNESVQHQPKMLASTSEIPTKSHKTHLRWRTSESDRRRRTRIAAALDALQGLLPQSTKGNNTNLVDDCIDYIKYLQLHIRIVKKGFNEDNEAPLVVFEELSRNRLGGEPTSNYLMFLEGYGHYLVHENTPIGPLQDMLVKLLNENPSEAAKFLESRDLFMMPISLN